MKMFLGMLLSKSHWQAGCTLHIEWAQLARSQKCMLAVTWIRCKPVAFMRCCYATAWLR